MTIGIYDSGIGGLNTLATIRKSLGAYDTYYFADNANMPYGTKEPFEIFKAVRKGLERLNDNSDIQVIACNTAATVTAPKTAFLLRPQIGGLHPENTLILATPATLSAIKANEKMYNTASTDELATLIEIAASLGYKNKDGNCFRMLSDYLEIKLSHYTNIKTVILGCSHYTYIKNIVENRFKGVSVNDGNNALCREISSKLPFKKGNSSVKFAFSGSNESDKYSWLLEEIEKGNI